MKALGFTLYGLLLILGALQILLFVAALFAIILNKKMTGFGKVLRFIEILILPLFGPIFVLIEVRRKNKR
jgi:hypothetical protein